MYYVVSPSISYVIPPVGKSTGFPHKKGITMTAARLTSLALALALAVAARGQVTTLTGNFTGTTLDAGWSVGGTGYTPQLTAAGLGDASGSGWLQLTSSSGNEATYAVDSTSFASTNATITATFNYAAFNG